MKTDQDRKKSAVREGYAKIAIGGGTCCGGGTLAGKISKNIGYSDEEMHSVPEGANLGLGCGNPVAIASIQEGDTVVDLGSGAGFDAFLASPKVGPRGTVIGVDMTPEMIEKAKQNAAKGQYENVEFRLGEIEHLPVADRTADLIFSNCVINLSTDKAQVFHEAFRVLKPGGKIMISDLVVLKELPLHVRESIEAYVGCLGGASLKETYLGYIRAAGFTDVRVMSENHYPVENMLNDPTAKALVRDLSLTSKDLRSIEKTVVSVRVEAKKPEQQTVHRPGCCS